MQINRRGAVEYPDRIRAWVFPRCLVTSALLGLAVLAWTPPAAVAPGPVAIAVVALVELGWLVRNVARAVRRPWSVRIGTDGVEHADRPGRPTWWEDVRVVQVRRHGFWGRVLPRIRLLGSAGDRSPDVILLRTIAADPDEVVTTVRRFSPATVEAR